MQKKGEARENLGQKKWVSYFYRTAQLSTLAAFPPWGSSRGAGRRRLTHNKNRNFIGFTLMKCKDVVKPLMLKVKKNFGGRLIPQLVFKV